MQLASSQMWWWRRCKIVMVFLPGLVVSLVFKHASALEDAIETLLNCSLVCKQWHHLITRDEVEDHRLWKAIAMRLSPAFPPDLSSLLFWEGDNPSWLSACKIHVGWSKAFTAPLSQSKLSPHISVELCDLGLTPVPASCYRIFILAASIHTSFTPFLIEHRFSSDLPQLADAIITFDYACRHFTILTAYGTIRQVQCSKLFPGIGGRCRVSGHCSKAMHIRKVCRCQLPMIFEACLWEGSDDDEDEYGDEGNGDDGGVHEENDDDSNEKTYGDDCVNDVTAYSTNDVTAYSTPHSDRHPTHDTHDANCNHHVEELDDIFHRGFVLHDYDHDEFPYIDNNDVNVDSKHVFVVHNLHGNLSCDLWVVSDEPFLYTYWQDLLVYSPWLSPGYSSEVVKCVEAGITGVRRWCTDIGIAPKRMEVNSQYVVVLGSAYDDDNDLNIRMLVLSMGTGQLLKSVSMELCIPFNMLITDTCLVINIRKAPVTVYRLPDLEAIYSLPLPNCDTSVSFTALSPCGRYLGLSSRLGDLVIYDMLEGRIKYSGSNGLGPSESCKRHVGDGVWLWYKDFKASGHCEEVAEKVVYWQLRKPDLDYYKSYL